MLNYFYFVKGSSDIIIRIYQFITSHKPVNNILNRMPTEKEESLFYN